MYQERQQVVASFEMEMHEAQSGGVPSLGIVNFRPRRTLLMLLPVHWMKLPTLGMPNMA
jgi:hypothetical protein